MAKNGKRTQSDWMIGAHPVNAYKKRVTDPAVRRKRRTSKDICRVIAQALNKVRYEGKTVYLSAPSYTGNPKPKTLYRIVLFKSIYYVLCIQNRVVSLFTQEMMVNDASRGGLVFRDALPFDELLPFITEERGVNAA